MELALQVNDDVLCGTLSGEVDLTGSIDAFTRVYRSAGAAGLKKALVDCSGVYGELSTIQRYELGEKVAELYHRDRGTLRIAVVGRPPLLTGFAAMVASNRGLAAQVFETSSDALKWLDRRTHASPNNQS